MAAETGVGLTFGKREKKMGIRSSATYELVFGDCRVPVENLIGNEGDGFKQTMHVLNGGRVGIAAQDLCIAEGALDMHWLLPENCWRAESFKMFRSHSISN